MKYDIRLVDTERGITLKDISMGSDLAGDQVLNVVEGILAAQSRFGNPYMGDIIITPRGRDLAIPPCEDSK